MTHQPAEFVSKKTDGKTTCKVLNQNISNL